jgi:hypothetical protein
MTAITPREAAYVIRLDGTTCLQLTDAGGIRRIKEGDPPGGQLVSDLF